MKRPYMRIASWLFCSLIVAYGICPTDSQAEEKTTDCKLVYTRTACPGQEAALKSKGGKDDMCLDYAKRDAEFNQCSKK